MTVRTSTDSSLHSLDGLESPPETSPTTPLEYLQNQHPRASKGCHYKKIHVLMFLCEDGDLRVRGEVQQLRNVFSSLYNFTTHISIIPSKNPSQHVKNEISELHHILSSSNNLVIVYYSKHEHLLKYGKLRWSAYQSVSLPQPLSAPSRQGYDETNVIKGSKRTTTPRFHALGGLTYNHSWSSALQTSSSSSTAVCQTALCTFRPFISNRRRQNSFRASS
jgi:hypothetical protein